MDFLTALFAFCRGLRAAVLMTAVVAAVPAAYVSATDAGWEAALPRGVWTPLHRMKAGDAVTFSLQKHSGSAFDTRRSRIFLFGSDTHGENWNNAPAVFDLESLSWQRLLEEDAPSSYQVNRSGLPVAGPKGAHPWAMHSFGAVDYHAAWDAIIVSSHPAHMEPGRFSGALAALWPQLERHPTWLFDLEQAEWSPLPRAQTSFFAYASTYDSDRGVMIGTGYHGVFELADRTETWRKTAEGTTIGYHNNAVYDTVHKALVMFGRNGLGNDVLVYRPKDADLVTMATPGLRPPRDEHVPMAFHPKLAESLAVVDRFPPGTSRQNRAKGRAETWAYDLEADRWRRISGAELPFALGMNYHLHYDPRRDLLLLVTSEPRTDLRVEALEPGFPEIWALRL